MVGVNGVVNFMANIFLDDIPRKNTNVIGRVLEGKIPSETEAVILLPEKGQVKVINEVGAYIWSLIDGTNTVRQIVALICSEYEVDQKIAERDANNFLADLVQRGIIQIMQQP